MNESSNNRRIAKNTLLLYGRMLFLMLISLFTSRAILNSLGVEDFGIYNTVGGVIIMFSFLSSSFSAAISRYLTYELGTGDLEKLKKTFSSAVVIQIVFALIIIILGETVGLWFVNEKLVIPDSRMYAANWAYQFTIASFAVNLISIPYNASIISHEKMGVFAWVSIFEAIGKLSIAYSVYYSICDKLIFYAGAMFALSLLLRIIYRWYCKRHFEECIVTFKYDKKLIKSIFSFSGWNSIGVFSAIVREQGGNILINLFFGPAINASRSIAVQVNTVLYGFVSNFMTALNPQITKNYANGNRKYMMELIFQGTRFSFYIMLFIALPVIVNAEYVLTIWLGVVPEKSVIFVQLTLLFTLNELLAGPLYTAMLATGDTRNYQIAVGGCQLLNFPLSFLALKLGASAEVVFVVAIVVGVCCEMIRIYMLRGMIGLPALSFLSKVYLRVWLVAICASVLPIYVKSILSENLANFFFIVTISVASVALSIYSIGLNKFERVWLKNKIKQIIKTIKHKICSH